MDVLLRPAVLAPALLATGWLVYLLLKPSKLPQLPVIGARPGEWFSLTRARWRNARDMRDATLVAYKQYRDQPCLLPIAGGNDNVVLPIKELQWLLDQPDSVLSMHASTSEDLQLQHTIMDPKLVGENPLHQQLISTTLTRETGNLIPELYDELRQSIDEIWGKDTLTHREVVVWDVMQRVIGRVTNRVFVGLPLCRNEELLKTGIACAQDIPVTATLLRFIWKPLRPIVGLFITMPHRIHTNRFYRIMKPEIDRRLKAFDAQQVDPEAKASKSESNDFLQWSIKQAKATGDPYHWKSYSLACRIMLLNFASIHTSSFAITHVLLDLASSKQEYIDELREEIREVLADHGGQWNKRTLAALSKLDSTMRESQRLNSFATLATSRTVVALNGVKTPSGVEVPFGARVCAQSYPVFHDESIYPDPYNFRPFRFAEKRNNATEGTYIEKARQAWATTSTEYTAFGHGRHACPGRFFASSELKLMLAYILMNYDLEFQEKRPDNIWFGMNRMPPMKATLKFKRRSI
ncbi:cytochrome P450 [Truncatella angustata]|uniref:Cytochrome P450 n=1 Tax=Truncatella angustata TaxID=152316 RepID=A0A9P9A1X9_9PEZI|nr:cytochrome P450 [Truncatella angustata]KAH6657410.1 cytochrome P450 [Truncatella angustata]